MNITLILIAITAVVSWLAWQRPRPLDALIYWPPAVARGEWWRLVSHGFIHADGGHLLFNMITLYFFGSVMERVLIPVVEVAGFVLFYLAWHPGGDPAEPSAPSPQCLLSQSWRLGWGFRCTVCLHSPAAWAMLLMAPPDERGRQQIGRATGVATSSLGRLTARVPYDRLLE